MHLQTVSKNIAPYMYSSLMNQRGYNTELLKVLNIKMTVARILTLVLLFARVQLCVDRLDVNTLSTLDV